MSREDVNPLIVFQELRDDVESQTKLILLDGHRLIEDDRIIFMLMGWFASKGKSTTGRAISPMLHLHVRDEEGLQIDWEVFHGFDYTGDVYGEENFFILTKGRRQMM